LHIPQLLISERLFEDIVAWAAENGKGEVAFWEGPGGGGKPGLFSTILTAPPLHRLLASAIL
jgi:hypothetical protein